MHPTRRTLLVGVAATFAGCTAPADGGGTESAFPTASATGDPTATPTPAGSADELDLREANVTRVEVSRSGTSISFDVTLYHDDDGEDGYANWWQVERLDGTQVGRRVLTHPHGTEPFTRSDSYEIPEDVACAVVRGHDQTHGYGGQVALVNLDSGAVSLVDQGAEPGSFDESDCP